LAFHSPETEIKAFGSATEGNEYVAQELSRLSATDGKETSNGHAANMFGRASDDLTRVLGAYGTRQNFASQRFGFL
jgi:hypothetical protein